MDYITHIAVFAGAGWSFYLIGQYAGLKDMNRRLNALASARDEYKAGVEHWIEEADRLSDLVAKYQSKQPERGTNGKFTSKRARVNAELQAYVASKKAA